MAEIVTPRCPNCGAPFHFGDLHCEYCGASLYVNEPTEIALPAVAEAQKIAATMNDRLVRNPYDGEAFYQLGLASFTLGLYEEAEHSFEQAERYLPGSALTHYMQGVTMLQREQPEILSISHFRLHEIQREFETALELDPNLQHANAYLNVIRGMYLRYRDDNAAAIAPLEAGLADLPKLGAGWHVLAAAFFQTGQYRDALRAAQRALEVEPNSEALTFMVGAVYDRLGESEQAEMTARKVAVLRGDADQWRHVMREFKGQFDDGDL